MCSVHTGVLEGHFLGLCNSHCLPVVSLCALVHACCFYPHTHAGMRACALGCAGGGRCGAAAGLAMVRIGTSELQSMASATPTLTTLGVTDAANVVLGRVVPKIMSANFQLWGGSSVSVCGIAAGELVGAVKARLEGVLGGPPT